MGRWLLLLLIFTYLTGCAGPRGAQEMQSGRLLFLEGEYKPAFRRLLPLAVCGNCQAQYAVGYMYFYGFGVAQDCESGLFWMTRSAEQGYPPAVRALAIIRHGPRYEGPCPTRVGPVCGSYVHDRVSYKNETDVVITHHPYQVRPVQRTYRTYLKQSGYSLNSMETTKPSPVTQPIAVAQDTTPKEIPTKAPIDPAPAMPKPNGKKYALQLFGAYQLENVKNLQHDFPYKKLTQIFHTKNKDKDWYVLTYGKYPTVQEARLAKSQLPSSVGDFKPWIRETAELDIV